MAGWEVAEDGWSDPGTTGDVLIVDDDAPTRAMLAFIFDDAGYRVVEAEDGADALEALRAEPPALMVLDLMMPEVDGVEVLRVRSEEGLAPDTRVLVLTAKLDTSDAVWCWELGADEYVTKPVDPDQLIRYGLALLARTPEELRHHREVGLEDARRLDAMEEAFRPAPPTRRGRRAGDG
jgi:DNA-binding response OmpR family regulator